MDTDSSSAGWTTLSKAQKHHNFYLDEFTFRLNRRRSRSHEKLFVWLAQQSGAVNLVPYDRTGFRGIPQPCAHIIYRRQLSQPDTQKLFRILAYREQWMHTSLRGQWPAGSPALDKTGSSFSEIMRAMARQRSRRIGTQGWTMPHGTWQISSPYRAHFAPKDQSSNLFVLVMRVKLDQRNGVAFYGLYLSILLCVGLGILALGNLREASASAMQAPAGEHPVAHPEFPPGDGRETTLRVCGKCHSPTIVLAYGQKRGGWEKTITKMVRLGAVGTDEDFTDIADYLTANFPPSAIPKIFVNKATDQQIANTLGISIDDAKAIIAYRDKVGGFKSIEDLKLVPSVDTKKIDAKKDNLVF